MWLYIFLLGNLYCAQNIDNIYTWLRGDAIKKTMQEVERIYSQVIDLVFFAIQVHLIGQKQQEHNLYRHI